jgi:NADH-quinone oxidoreductase subunit H
LLLVLSLGVYGTLLVGFGGASKYSLIGGMRAAAQSVRYEVSFAIILLVVVLMRGHVGLPVNGRLL